MRSFPVKLIVINHLASSALRHILRALNWSPSSWTCRIGDRCCCCCLFTWLRRTICDRTSKVGAQMSNDMNASYHFFAFAPLLSSLFCALPTEKKRKQSKVNKRTAIVVRHSYGANLVPLHKCHKSTWAGAGSSSIYFKWFEIAPIGEVVRVNADQTDKDNCVSLSFSLSLFRSLVNLETLSYKLRALEFLVFFFSFFFHSLFRWE